MGVNRSEADRAGRVRVAQTLDHPGVGQPEAAAGLGFAHYQLARAGAGGLLRRHREAAAGAALGGLDHAPAAAGGAEDSDQHGAGRHRAPAWAVPGSRHRVRA